MPEQDAEAAAAGSAAPAVVARLVNLDTGLFAFSLTGATPWHGSAAGLELPAVHISAVDAAKGAAVEITSTAGQLGAWLGGRSDTVFVRSPAGGGAALITAYLGRDPSGPPLALAIRRLDAPKEVPIRTVSFDLQREPGRAGEVSLEIVLHIRGRGDVYFLEPGWVGRIGPGAWVEAFTILPLNELAAAAIEYKGLSASGVETAWLPSGSMCGTSGKNIPLLGFAVRQKAGVAGARFDCEYSGYFQSGAVSGPARNGAPCRSPASNDPLEGLQVQIVNRSAKQ